MIDLRRVKSMFKVGEYVTDILDPNRKADQIGRRSES